MSELYDLVLVHLCIQCQHLLVCLFSAPSFRPYHDIIEWQKCHCDPHTVLQAGSNLSVASRYEDIVVAPVVVFPPLLLRYMCMKSFLLWIGLH